MDHDTIIRHDLALLYRMRMTRVLAAAREWGNGTFAPYRKTVGPRDRRRLPKAEQEVFNSGVLVIDLERVIDFWTSSNFC